MNAAVTLAFLLLAAAPRPAPPPIIAPPGSFGEHACFNPVDRDWEQSLPRGGRNSFSGRDTGAWSMVGNSHNVPDGYFTSMTDTNPFRRGSLYAVVQKYGDGGVGLVVGAAGAVRQRTAGWQGRAWNRLSRARRSARVKAALVRFARAAAGECGGRLETLRDEIATFDRAFAVLDGWRPGAPTALRTPARPFRQP